MYNEALCEKTWCPLILNMVSVDISMVKICLVNKFMVISSLHTGCPAKHVHFFIFYQPKLLIQIPSLEVLQTRSKRPIDRLKYFIVEVEKNF